MQIKTTTVARLQPGQTFRFVGGTGTWHTLTSKQDARAQGYRVLTYATGVTYSCHHTTKIEVQ